MYKVLLVLASVVALKRPQHNALSVRGGEIDPIAIGKGEFKFSLVGVAGSDIAVDGSKKLSLALIWQLMRAYTLSLLSQVRLFIRIIMRATREGAVPAACHVLKGV